MKNLSVFIISPLLLASLLAFPNHAKAQTEYWDPTTTQGTGSGGSGTWSSGTPWFNGTADVAWPSGAIAVFDGNSGTVALGASETASGLNFGTAGYTISGGTGLSLTLTAPAAIITAGGTTTINNVLAGSSGLTYGGSGTLILSGANTYTGGTTITNGTLQISAASGLGPANPSITFANNAILNNNAAAITSSGTITLNSGGGQMYTATLSGLVTGGGGLTFHKGDTILSSTTPCNYGTITMAANNRLFISNTNAIKGATLVASASGAYLDFQCPNGANLPNPMSFVSGSILTARAAVGSSFTVSTANVSFPTTGTMIFNQDTISSTGAATVNIIINGNYPTLTGNMIINVGGGTGTANVGSVILNGGFSDGGAGNSLTKNSPDANFLTTLYVNGTNGYTGDTTINAGGFTIGGSGCLGVSTTATNYPGNINLVAVNSTLTNGTSANQIWSGQISGSGTLTQNGPGTLALNNSENYTGATTINGGTLALSTNGSITSSRISIAAGTTLDVSVASQANGGSYTFSNPGLSASGSSAPSTINGASGGTINLGTATISLVYNATNYPLSITFSGGTPGMLAFNGNSFIINNTGPALADGSYPLIQVPTGTTISPSSGVFAASVTGNGLVNAGDNPEVEVSGGAVILVVGHVNRTSEVWDGADFNNNQNWSDSTNWASGTAPDPSGDVVTFAGTTGLSPNMDNAYNVFSLGFATNAGSFTLSSSANNVLSVTSTVSNNSASAQTLNMPVSLVGVTSPWFIQSNSSITLNGPLSDNGNGLALSGGGTLNLTAANTFTGGMSTSSNSTINVSGDLGDNGSGSGSYGGNLANNGTLIFSSGSAQTLSGVISGAGTLNQSGFNTLALRNAANTYSGGTTINGGALSISADTDLGTGPLTFINNGKLENTILILDSHPIVLVSNGTTAGIIAMQGNNFTIGASVTGGGGLSVGGADFILEPTNNANIGIFTQTANRVFVSSASALGTNGNQCMVNVLGGELIFQSGPTSAQPSPLNPMSFNSGTSLTARATLAGPLTVNTTNVSFPTSGTMVFNNDLDSTATTNIFINGNYPMLQGSLTIQLGSSSSTGAIGTVGNVTLNGGFSDGGAGDNLTVTAPGTALGNFIVEGTNGYSGDTTITAGGFTIAGAGCLGVTATATNYAGTITLTAATSALNNATSANQIWSGQISGAGSLTQSGTGTLTLTTAEAYTGATTISGGTLALGAGGSISASPSISVGLGATFDVTGADPYALGSTSFSASSPATINDSATGGAINFGSQPISLTYDGSHPLTISAGTLSLTNNAFTVNTAAPLAAGTYVIVHQAAGSIANTGSHAVSGTFLRSGGTGAISVIGGNVNLMVTEPLPPSPTITSVSVSGTTLTITATNGATSGTYVLLQSTNLALPLNGWTPVITNSFNASGDINISTNVVNTNSPEEFYILKQTQ